MESMYACVVITALLKRNRCHFVEHGRAHDKWYSDITGKSFRVPRQSGRSLFNSSSRYSNQYLKGCRINLNLHLGRAVCSISFGRDWALLSCQKGAKMSKYSYPAIFFPEGESGYSLRFPDLEGCYTCGSSMI